jgi:hypothetical protein
MNKFMIAAAIWLIAAASADPNTPDVQKPAADDKAPALDETVVGESVPMHLEMFYSPAIFCKVDAEANIYVQLSQCKNQRKGWLKI